MHDDRHGISMLEKSGRFSEVKIRASKEAMVAKGYADFK